MHYQNQQPPLSQLSSASTACEQPDKRSRDERHGRHASEGTTQDSRLKEQERNKHGWRRIVLNFAPSWFSVTMGTGIVSILLHNLPYNAHWLHWLSVITFCLNILLFTTFLALSILRYIMFRGLFCFMISHPVQSVFTGTFPMGLAMLINMIVYICVPVWGSWATSLAWGLWWVDAAIAAATCLYLPFVIMHKQESDLSKITATWLLPVVATIVASASGGIVAEVLPNPEHRLWTIIASYILWGTGFPLAMVVLVLYFHRLAFYKLPPREVIVSVFLPLGPLGQGSFALMQLGLVAQETFPATGTINKQAGTDFYNLGVAMGLVIWGYGLVWLFFAIASISRHGKFPFNVGWWGFTFPLGVYSTSTTKLGRALPSPFFKVLGTVFSLTVICLWLVVSVMTLINVVKGKLFDAPCVEPYERQRASIARRRASDLSKKEVV